MGMATKRMRTRILIAATGLALTLAGASTLAAVSCSVTPRLDRQDGVFVVRAGRVEYRFDAVWRTESLMRRPTCATASVESLTETEPQRLERLRRVLLRSLGVATLDEIDQEGAAELESLRALGYL